MLILLIIITSCSWDQAAFVIRNESSDTIRVNFHFGPYPPFIGEYDSGHPNGVDSIGLESLRQRFGVIKYHDSTITHNLERNQEYTNYIFNNYYKDSLPVYVFLVLSDCEYKGPNTFIYANTKNAKKYERGKQLCEVLSVPPSQYYKNDTSNYSKLLNNILPIYINPGETYMTIKYWPYASTSAEDPIVKYDKVEIIKDQKVVYSFSHDNFKKYFRKTNVFGSRNSYMLTIKD